MTTETTEITNSEDVIDVRDVIARVEQLEDLPERNEDADDEDEYELEREELQRLNSLLENLAGNGGDEDWRGAWYPVTLVRDSYFQDYAQQEAEDLDLVKPDARWPYTCIDWERAASELQQDYSTVEFDGVTFWYR